jgi:rSAM/selenodomain-associated transferase 1
VKNRNALIIFAKSPAGGNVKTRLASHLNENKRLKLYTALLDGTVEKLRDIPGADTLISYAGDGEYFGNFGLRMFPQAGGDLGRKMHIAIDKVLGEGYLKAVLVGVDIPGLSDEIIRKAFNLLEDCDAVFGPARDGGYYLVGLKAPTEEIFNGIEWSTEATLKQTLAKAESTGLKVSLTDTLSDIDRPEDLEKLLSKQD